MTDSTAVDTPEAPAADGVSCFVCLYDLRGMGPDAKCPECGHPVGASRGVSRIERADGAAVRKVRLGLMFAAGEYVALLVAVGAGTVAGLMRWEAEWLVPATFVAMAVGTGVGGWLSATPLPPLKTPGLLRASTRVFSVLVALHYVVLIVLNYRLGHHVDDWPGQTERQFAVTALSFAVTAALRAATLGWLLVVIARHLPGRMLRRSSVAAAVVLPVAWVVMGLGMGLNDFFGDVPEWVPTVMALFFVAAVIGAIVYLFRYHRVLRLVSR